MNRKGSLLDTVIWVILAFIVIMFFGMWLFMHGIITDAFVAIPDTNTVNISKAVQATFVPVNSALVGGLHLLTFVMMFAFALSIFISNYLVKGNPIFVIMHIFITIIAVGLAAAISNNYEIQLANDAYGATLQGFTGANFIMMNLPIWAAVIGIIGMVFLFIGIIRDSEFGTGV